MKRRFNAFRLVLFFRPNFRHGLTAIFKFYFYLRINTLQEFSPENSPPMSNFRPVSYERFGGSRKQMGPLSEDLHGKDFNSDDVLLESGYYARQGEHPRCHYGGTQSDGAQEIPAWKSYSAR